MNTTSSSITQYHEHYKEQYFLKANYTQATIFYEKAIENEPEVKSNYWYLGLSLLLQGQEIEAQTTWFMAMLEGEPEEVEQWNTELVDILDKEAERQEKLEEYSIAWAIRQQIKNIHPRKINNLLLLVQLAIELGEYTGEELNSLDILEILKLELLEEVNNDLLISVLGNVLHFLPLHPLNNELMEACLPYCKDNPKNLYNTFLGPAMEIAYSYRQPGIAAELCNNYLKIDSNNTEILANLSGFYQNADEYGKGIETAKILYELVTDLPEKIFASRQILRGLMMAGGRWSEAYSFSFKHEYLLTELIENFPLNLEVYQLLKVFNANYFSPYFDDKPREFRYVQNKISEICHKNHETHAQPLLEKYKQGIIHRKTTCQLNRKLKIGYLSHCLKRHSVGWLCRSLFQHHNHDNFHIYGYFMGKNVISDPLHQWYVNTVDQHFHSNCAFTLAEKIYEDKIDILIDLDSVTIDTICEVLTLKPAPIQVTWLGWDASGIPNVDYFIADPYVLPESANEYYSEKIWRLPQTYIAIDGFEVSPPTLRREDLEIPSDAIVYLCAQRGFKLHPEIVKLQLQVLKEVENSYFLIKGVADEESSNNFFKKLTEKEGVDYSRLRFLPGVPSEASHRANLAIADVVLDTFPYNGATTTMETLWMCIPMVTKVGEQFAARNSYTMMMNAGITEGIAWSDEEYVQWAVRLGKDEALRQEISWKLRQSRKTAPLWNGKQFACDMEQAYIQMWQRYMGE